MTCTVLDQDTFQELFNSDDEHPKDIWDNRDRFYEKYPGSYGIIQLSRIGFDTEGNQAFVYVGNSFHDLAGAG